MRTTGWPRIPVFAAFGVALLAACGAPTSTPTSPPTSPPETIAVETTPVLQGDHALGMTLPIQVDGDTRPTMIDTGSIYYFQSVPPGKLPCKSPEFFYYAVGKTTFCPSSQVVTVVDTGGSAVALRDEAMRMGLANFADWEPGIPDEVLGLAGNLVGENRAEMKTVLQQLNPDQLAFQFPNGGLAKGEMSFGALPADRLAAVSPVPLVSPGNLGYGYTSRVKRMEFVVNDKVDTVISYESDGVFLSHASSRRKIADQHLAFFDTGTPLPLVFSNGDVSLLSKDVAAGNIGTKTTGTFYSQLNVVFEDADGEPVTLTTTNLAPFQANNPSAVVPTAAEFPKDMKVLATVIGYPVLTEYDFQIAFGDDRAQSITFVSR